jgi:N-acetylmuramoyl-L-alanine amidase
MTTFGIKKLIIPVLLFLVSCPTVFASQDAESKVVKILIVPGHDQDFPGAKYKNLREADMAVAVALQLEKFLAQDPNIKVTVSRNNEGYLPALLDYFANETLAVNKFIADHSLQMKKKLIQGTVTIPAKQVPHGNASKTSLYRLYAINKWATEQKYDLIIHIHFDDEGSRRVTTKGKYSGYSVYVPDSNLLGSEPSKDLGTTIALRLKRDFKKSTMPYEQKKADANGVISDMKLIALGANKTVAIPRVLIEYAYIYDPLVSPKNFPLSSDVMAAATDYGIHDFLREKIPNLCRRELDTVTE